VGRAWTLSLSAVGTSRCDVTARAAAGGTNNVNRSTGELRRWTRRGRRSAPSLPRTVSRCAPANLSAWFSLSLDFYLIVLVVAGISKPSLLEGV